jgi:hypothetical protein
MSCHRRLRIASELLKHSPPGFGFICPRTQRITFRFDTTVESLPLAAFAYLIHPDDRRRFMDAASYFLKTSNPPPPYTIRTSNAIGQYAPRTVSHYRLPCPRHSTGICIALAH